jgi:hypothetical protein
MRTIRTQKLMDQSDPGSRNSEVKEMTERSATTLVADSPSWITRAIPTGMARVPTHAVRAPQERRAYSRAKLSLALRVKRVAGQRENEPEPLRTMNISSSGVLFLSPQFIEPGTPVEIEISLVDRPLGRGSVKMLTEAHIVRADAAMRPGWHMLAVTFDDITFQREEPLPSRFQSH